MARSKYLIFLFILVSCSLQAQKEKFSFKKWFPKYEVSIHKFGPYVGYQTGAYNKFEFGEEFQWKRVKFIHPHTNALHAGVNYDFKQNVLGYEIGYWNKTGRLNLTYGINSSYQTNFTSDLFSISPVVGFKLSQLHLQTGYNFTTRNTTLIPTNSFFISLRFVFIQKWDVQIDKN
jgi:hypothetical protein